MATVNPNQPISVEMCEVMYLHYDERSRDKNLPFPIRYMCLENARHYLRLHEQLLPFAQLTKHLFIN